MKPTTISWMALVAATQFLGAFAATKAAEASPTPSPSTLPVLNQQTSHGCYSSGGNLTLQGDVQHVSSGNCGNVCRKLKYAVMGLHAGQCYCGVAYPPKDDSTKDDECNYPCPGYGVEPCGGLDTDAYSIFNTGLEIAVPNYEPDSSTTAGPTSTKAGSKTSAVETAVVTRTDGPSPTESSGGEKKKGPNVAAIAAGVVVGVVVMAAIVGALFFFVRRKRNAEIEEEHRRNAAVNAFINGSKPPGSSGSISMTDSRLDPVMAHRRMSDGSIADNQDYSRRILRVTNA